MYFVKEISRFLPAANFTVFPGRQMWLRGLLSVEETSITSCVGERLPSEIQIHFIKHSDFMQVLVLIVFPVCSYTSRKKVCEDSF